MADGSEPRLRAVLWNGRLDWHLDSFVFGAQHTHDNFFSLMSDLKRAALEWKGHSSRKTIEGIDTSMPCWPIDPRKKFSPDVFGLYDAHADVTHSLAHSGFHKGMYCLVRTKDRQDFKPGAVLETLLYDVMPLPPQEEIISGAVIKHSLWNHNLFEVAHMLQPAVRAVARKSGVTHVPGIDDRSECWPVGLGEMRFG
jgi:hypothetical protein